MKPTYRFVMRSYDDAYRTAHGAEIVETAAELGGGVWSVRQSASLAVAGLKTRALAASQGSAKNVWGQAIFTAFGLLIAMNTAVLAAYILGIQGGMGQIEPDARIGLIIVGSQLFILTRRMNAAWFAALVGTALVAGYVSYAHGDSSLITSLLPVSLLIGAVGWAAAATSARRSFPTPASIGLVVVGLLVAWVSDTPAVPAPAMALAVLAVGLVLVRIDPRALAVATVIACWLVLILASSAVGANVSADRTLLIAVGITAAAAGLIFLSRSGIRRLHAATTAGAH